MTRMEKILNLVEQYKSYGFEWTLERTPPHNLWKGVITCTKMKKAKFYIGNLNILKLIEFKELYQKLEYFLIEKSMYLDINGGNEVEEVQS